MSFGRGTLVAVVRALVTPFKPLVEALAQCEAGLSAAWAASAHHRLMLVQWGLPPVPEHFDHSIDIFYLWRKTRNPQGIERGIFGGLALQGGDVLELACGDGFNARNFYSVRSKRVVACDFDFRAIRTAKRKNRAPNVGFVQADIRNDMPEGLFDNVVWDAAIEHFTPAEVTEILMRIKTRLRAGGVLSGHTIVKRADGRKSLSYHEYEFRSKEDLYECLHPYFRHVSVFETIYPNVHNLYFWASDGTIPFAPEWPHVITGRTLSVPLQDEPRSSTRTSPSSLPPPSSPRV